MRIVLYALMGVFLANYVYSMSPYQREEDKGKEIVTVNNGLVDIGNYKRKRLQRNDSNDDEPQCKYTRHVGEDSDILDNISDEVVDNIIDMLQRDYSDTLTTQSMEHRVQFVDETWRYDCKSTHNVYVHDYSNDTPSYSYYDDTYGSISVYKCDTYTDTQYHDYGYTFRCYYTLNSIEDIEQPESFDSADGAYRIVKCPRSGCNAPLRISKNAKSYINVLYFDLRQHIRKKHMVEGEYICSCGKILKNRGNILNHKKSCNKQHTTKGLDE